MTKSQIQQMSQGMSDLYTGLETDLISNIADYLKSGDIYSSTAQWKIQMLAQLGALDKANIKTISNYAGMSPSLLSQALETASLTAINELEGGFRQLVKDGIINGTNVPVEDTMAKVLKSYNKQAKNSLNMVNTVMLYKAKSITGKIINQTAEIANKPEYIAMLSKATGKVITGIESRQSAMRQCIQEMTAKGIPAFVDKLGREWSPEAYINMNIRTTLSNTANTAQMERMSDYGINLVEVSSHSGARPKCAKYQGRIFDKSNKSQKYPHWKDTSYGQPDGLLGINCGHQIYPYIEGVSVQRYFPYNKDTNDKAYRLSQHQRELERRVRKSKRECMVLEKLGDDKGLKRASATLKNRKQALEKFSAANNLPVRTDRTAVVGYNKSIAGKVKNSLTFGSSGGKIRPYEIKKSRQKRLEIISRGISEERPIFAVDTATNKFASYVRNVPPKKDYYDVALHGAPTYAEFFGEEIDAYTLASIIRNREDYPKGSKVRLLSCSTGDTTETGNCFAQILADELGVQVEAPTQIINIYPNGTFFVDDDFDPINPKGIMKLFYPRKV